MKRLHPATTLFARRFPGAVAHSCAFALAFLATAPPLEAQDRLLPVIHFDRLTRTDGLPTSGIRSRVVLDREGYAWIGTDNGLVRYDGHTFAAMRNEADNPHAFASRVANSILLDRKGRLWIGGWENGLSLYHRSAARFINFAPGFGVRTDYRPAPTLALLEDRSGNIWLGMEGGGAACVTLPAGMEDLDTLARRARFTVYPLGSTRNAAADLHQRADGTLLVASDSGVVVIDPADGTRSRLGLRDPAGTRLDRIAVQCFFEDSRGRLWIGTSSDGLYRLDRDGRTIRRFSHEKGNPRTIGSNVVWDVAEDRDGRLWVGHGEGVDIISPETGERLPHLAAGASPGVSALTRLSVDPTGTVWIGTATEGLFSVSRKSLRIPNYSLPAPDGTARFFECVEPGGDGTLWAASQGMIYQIDGDLRRVLRAIDVYAGRRETFRMENGHQLLLADGDLWYGTWGLGLYRIDLPAGTVSNFFNASPYGRSGVAVSVARGGDGNLYVAAYSDGLLRFEPATGEFSRVPLEETGAVLDVVADRKGNIWVCDEGTGMCLYDPLSGASRRFSHNQADPGSLSHNRAWLAACDRAGRIWVGAGNVVNLYDSAASSFRHYPNPQFDDVTFSRPLGLDATGKLWVDYARAVALLHPDSGFTATLGRSDGICSEVTDMALLPGGTVILSGASGMNVIDPASVAVHRPPPPLLITRMAINDTPAPPPAFPATSGPLQLTHDQNVLEFEFAAPDLAAPQLVAYRYMLEGVDKEWVEAKNRRYVRYAGLRPGAYVFRVSASSVRSEWPERHTAYAIAIAPPWWRTWWAYGIWSLLLGSIVYAAVRLRLRQAELRHRAELEHLQAERLAETDRMKSRFFANISHEFRTPLTLVLGPIRRLLEKPRDDQERKDLGMAERNASRLLGLVNQLLDLSRLDAGAMRLRARRTNVVPLIRGIANSFESSAGMRGISLEVTCEPEEIEAYVDPSMLEQILVNLLANALKFTPDGGRVTVSAGRGGAVLPASARDGAPPDSLHITVRDTGVGIPPEELPRVFDRFFQVDSSQTRGYEGTGIGLAVVKELVALHHGSIAVWSEVGQGSEFSVRLPLGRRHLEDTDIDSSPESTTSPAAGTRAVGIAAVPDPEGAGTAPAGEGAEKPVVLVVEDNADVRSYIKDHLSAGYVVLEASNGAEGIERAREAVPDLVISDIMMPRMSGSELCRTLKNDVKTSHIPIVLLTAKAGSEDRIEGLGTGADDYLVKPFEPKELAARVKNLVEGRRKLREHFRVPLRPGEITVTSMDDAFLQKAVAAVQARIAEPAFGVDELAAEMAMSRSQLHRKLTAITGQSAGGFIRYLRLHRADELLRGNAGTVAEIAYAVGFEDPSHFSRRFHDLFGFPPSEVRSRAQEVPQRHQGPERG